MNISASGGIIRDAVTIQNNTVTATIINVLYQSSFSFIVVIQPSLDSLDLFKVLWVYQKWPVIQHVFLLFSIQFFSHVTHLV